MTQFDLSTTDTARLIAKQTYKPRKPLTLQSLNKSTLSRTIILADISGSMSGEKIHELKRALSTIWRPGLEGIAFESELWAFEQADIQLLQPRGSTNMSQALQEAWNMQPERIILLTDGMPDEGNQAIIGLVQAHPSPPIDTVAIGYDCANSLLQEISRLTGGQFNAVGDPLKLTDTLVKLLEFSY